MGQSRRRSRDGRRTRRQRRIGPTGGRCTKGSWSRTPWMPPSSCRWSIRCRHPGTARPCSAPSGSTSTTIKHCKGGRQGSKSSERDPSRSSSGGGWPRSWSVHGDPAGSRLRVADNYSIERSALYPGARRISNVVTPSIGDVFIATVKDAVPGAAVKKGEVVRCVVVRTKKEKTASGRELYPLRREHSSTDQRPTTAEGTRILGSMVVNGFRDKRFMRIVSPGAGGFR